MRNSGFSLIEILIVMIILGLLATVLAPRIMDRPDEARVTKAAVDIKQLETALKLYKLDNGRYPTTAQGLQALVEQPRQDPVPKNYREGGYLERKELPKDPWGTPFIYRSPGRDKRPFELISLGADGKEGGEQFDADVNSWEIE
ncbi:type II secretion system major pseudopilin GspG [Megalodesulfovibrio gigas]|uniref:Type II secretion system core protein G n=1 Tax=Megalodesulfovibrio gigas (strain ATCC 19364 / DSM 1382 / NCIMB 9332 / VKM B-1759) TaxID=1121448 RepID=T2GGB2_MEGG1|nr:type II secretion system major pseudopilin GspG [Megalodesulfovibrio gigas]AGW15284.1 general secretion pathway protein G [Megalodesulfovibrio gigas DSM 1382 = ATCC 19364]